VHLDPIREPEGSLTYPTNLSVLQAHGPYSRVVETGGQSAGPGRNVARTLLSTTDCQDGTPPGKTRGAPGPKTGGPFSVDLGSGQL